MSVNIKISNIKNHKRLIAILYDLLVVPIAWLGAYWLRFNLDQIPKESLQIGLHLLPIVLLIQSLAYWYVGLYRGIWRFSS